MTSRKNAPNPEEAESPSRAAPGGHGRLTVRMLGGFEASIDGERLRSLEANRLRSLFAYLLLHRAAPQARTHVAFTFWPDSNESQARTNLRQLLHHLRNALPGWERFLAIDDSTIQWRPDGPWILDVDEFETRSESVFTEDSERLDVVGLEEAVAVYHGDLLPGAYDEWILPIRDEFSSRHLEVRRRLAEIYEVRREYANAIVHAEGIVARDPLDEDTWRTLMRLHALRGDHTRAMGVYHVCSQALKRELGVAPEAATTAAYEALLGNRETEAGVEAATAMSPDWQMIGRVAEWETALQAWRQASSGPPLMLAVSGEAGIGKSRLVEELCAWCSQQGIAIAVSRCYEAEGALAYAPVVEWLRSDAVRHRRHELPSAWTTELGHLLPELRTEESPPQPPKVSDAEQRQRLFEAMAMAFTSGEGPLLLVLDDIQWADGETTAFLHYLLRRREGARVLVAVTARSDELTSNGRASAILTSLREAGSLVEIALEPLDVSDTAELARSVGNRALDGDLAAEIHAETAGNPLFVVELVRAGLWPDNALPAGDDANGQLPHRLRTLIERRLARLASTEIVELAAVAGREFGLELLRRAGGFDEEELVRGLDEMWQQRVVRELRFDRYDFMHDRIREVAYESIGPARRIQLHGRVADAMTAVARADPGPVSGVIAAHYESAGRWDHAITYHVKAAAAAREVFAEEEAIAALRRGLDLVDRIEADGSRMERELELLTTLTVPLVVTEGYTPEVYEVFARARSLCHRLGRPTAPPILRALAISGVSRCDLEEAQSLGEELASTASVAADPLLSVEADYVLGVTGFWMGEFLTARRHLDRAVNNYRPENHHLHVALFAQDPKVVCLSRLALTLWYLGRPSDAEITAERALRTGEELGHPFSQAYAMWFVVRLADELGQTGRVRELLDSAASLTGEHRLSFRNEPLGTVFEGWLRVRDGDLGGIDLIEERIADALPVDQAMHSSLVLKLAAEAHVLAGDGEAALKTSQRAIEDALISGQRYQLAELRRIEAQALALLDAPTDDVEVAFRQAVTTARGQGALSLELRAAKSRLTWMMSRRAGSVLEQAVRDMDIVCGRFPGGQTSDELLEARRLVERFH